MIIKDVPFIYDQGEKYGSCQGPTTLMMVLRFFDINISFPELYKKMNYKKGKWFFETYIVGLLFSYGISCKYYSDSELEIIGDDVGKFEKISSVRFNEKHRNEFDIDHYDSSVSFVLSKGLFEKSKVDVNFIIKQLKRKKLIIATINRSKLTGNEGYKGHFILVKEFDNGEFICNDCYLGENIKIPINKFSDSFYYIENKKKTHHVVVVG